jgi:hypothetical protein
MEEKIGSQELGNYLKRVSSVHGMLFLLSRTFRSGMLLWFGRKVSYSRVNQEGGDGKTGIMD